MCGLTLSYKTKAIYSGLISLNVSPPICINYLKHLVLKNKLGENCVLLKAAQLLMRQECSDTSNTVDSDMNYLSPKASPNHSACFIFVWRKGLRDELEECISSGSSGVTVLWLQDEWDHIYHSALKRLEDAGCFSKLARLFPFLIHLSTATLMSPCIIYQVEFIKQAFQYATKYHFHKYLLGRTSVTALMHKLKSHNQGARTHAQTDTHTDTQYEWKRCESQLC